MGSCGESPSTRHEYMVLGGADFNELNGLDQSTYTGLADFIKKAKLRVKLDEAFVTFKIKFSNSVE